MKKRDREWMRKLRNVEKARCEIGKKKLERIETSRKRGTTVRVTAKQCRGSSSRIPDDDNRKGRGWERDTRPRRWMKKFVEGEVSMWKRGDYAGDIGACTTNYKNHCCR
jgi:predicted nucleic acid binding AN1-type Zn finger protein